MHKDHIDIKSFRSFEEYFDGNYCFDYKESIEENKNFFGRFGYDLNDHALKYTFLRECIKCFVIEDDNEQVLDMLDQLHILQYNEYINKIKTEFNKFDPSKKWSRRLKKVYFVQFRKINNALSFCIYPYTNFIKKLVNDSNASNTELTYFNIKELIQKLDCGEHDIWLGEPMSLGDFGHVGNTVIKFPILFFEKEYAKEELQFFRNYEVAWRTRWDDTNFDEIGRLSASMLDSSLYRAFPDINVISTTPYEGKECTGYMLIGNEIPDIELIEPVRLNEHKRIRKLLEVSDDNLVLLINPFTFMAYGLKTKKNNEGFMGIFIEFKNKLSWYCSINNVPIFQSNNFQIKLPIINTRTDNEIERAIRTVFEKTPKVINNRDVTLLNKLVITASEQKKGTILVILERETAISEAKRLTQSSTIIKPKKLNIQLLKRISGIDGAIILDTKGICHAFGVILDGRITKGDPGRGARFNSAHRYFNTKEEEQISCLLIVVSEDGHVSVLPDKFEI